jgi:hypothetical protein
LERPSEGDTHTIKHGEDGNKKTASRRSEVEEWMSFATRRPFLVAAMLKIDGAL